jgi:hypothetical protein
MLERSLKGSFGFTSQGALVANFPPAVIGPFGEIGRQTFDGRGNTEGTRRHHAAGEGGQLALQREDCPGQSLSPARHCPCRRRSVACS